MSRVGKQPIKIPAGVTVSKGSGREVSVKGPNGNLTMTLRPEIELEIEGDEAKLSPNGSGSARDSRAFHGMSRALLNNMVVGVSQGFEKKLEIQGVGWGAKAGGKQITLNVGYCHPVVLDMPEGVTCETPNATSIIIKGADRQAVGQIAAEIRKQRPPEPYKGKGIRYVGEYVRRKAGKSFGS